MSNESIGQSRLALSPFLWKLVLTIHIIVSVGLLGDSAGYLAVAIRGAIASDPLIAHASYQTLRMFAWLLLDSRVVDLPRSSNLIVVTLFSLKPLFVNGLKKALHFS